MDKKNLLLLAVAMLSLRCLPALGADAAPANCGLKLYGEIDLQVIDGSARVPVTLNGHDGFMALNIASAFTMLSQQAVNELQLPNSKLAGNMPTFKADAKTISRSAKVTSLTIGKVPFGRAEFLVAPHADSTWGDTLFGAMGMDMFQHVDLEVDLSRRKLRIFSQDHCAGQVVYWAHAFASAPIRKGAVGNYYFPLEIDGKQVETTLSPASQTTMLHTDISRKLYGFDEKSPGVETLQDEDGNARHEYRAMQITTPGLNISNTKVRLVPPAGSCMVEVRGRKGGAAGYTNCEGAFPLTLGMNVLRELRFYIATKESVLYFTAANAGMPATAGTP